MAINLKLLYLLADGSFHSGTELGHQLGISRSAVWKAISALVKETGLDVHAVRGRGYRLRSPVELLDKARLLSELHPDTLAKMAELDVMLSIDSTNKYLMAQMLEGASSGRVVLAEYQQQGRGRRGRHWVSPFASNLYLSVLWRFASGPERLTTLSLRLAVALVKALESLGIEGLSIKWPNDIYAHDRKLAGILTEMRAESGGPSAVVCGVGINIAMPEQAGREIDQPWIDLQTLAGSSLSRNRLAARIIDALFTVLSSLMEGSENWIAEWQRYDWLQGREVDVHFPDRIESGIAMGVDAQGALRLVQGQEEILCHSGEVSLHQVKQDSCL